MKGKKKKKTKEENIYGKRLSVLIYVDLILV